MVATALSEGFGLLLFVPLRAFVGLPPPETCANLMRTMLEAAHRIEVPLSLELVVLTAFGTVLSIRQPIVYISACLSENTTVNDTAAIRVDILTSIGVTS